MLGIPVTYLPKFGEGTNGYTIAVDLDDLFLDEMKWIQAFDLTDASALLVVDVETDLLTLNEYLNSTEDDVPEFAWAVSSSLLYIFFNDTYFPYESNICFLPFGYRSGIPINNLNTYIDVPEKHLPLYSKYVIREAALFLGKQVPPSIIKEINDLETKLV